MHGVQFTRYILGIIGNVISGGLFLAPCPTFWRIIKKKDTEDFHPYPYLAMMMNCILWVWYGTPIIHPGGTLIWTINAAGVAIQTCYLIIFAIYTNSKNRKVIAYMLLLELVVFGAIVAASVLGLHTTQGRSLVDGIICVVFGTIMYASPLSNLVTVFKTKSSEFMPFGLILVGLINGCVWFGYGFLWKFDINLVIANGLGALVSLFQLIVCVWFWNGKTKKEQLDVDVKPATDVQLNSVV